MNCPHCGADTKNAVTLCPLCGKTLDREMAYAGFVSKADDALAAEDYDKAIISYRKALEYSQGTEDIYLKLAAAYNKKGDKQAASMYMKALTFNFYNEHTHNMLIALYSRYGRLDDLQKWYEQSRDKADPEFIDKHIKIIKNVKYFSYEAPVKIPASKPDNFLESFMLSMKKYVILNIVMGIIGLVATLAIIAAVVFKVNTTYIVMSAGVFIMATITILLMTRKKRGVKKDAGQATLEAMMAEIKKSKTDPGGS
jgi:hypothetical protein